MAKKQKDFTHNIYLHVTRNCLMGLGLIILALLLGMLGYHGLEHLSWLDSFLNAAMILSGMGPATTMTTTAGKLFAGCYALFSGLAFIAIIVVLLSPVIHRFFRKMHLELEDNE
jgi:hypothetical protein